ncbi:DUF4225 domain-containing protein [Pseudomonas sp. NPDC089392]|uniref:DUF4225 domain-containing protein n=1 Tax=Pseudomonas sp. NPDC089392 TaxID=3364459 RepID=UPI0038091A68
MNRQEYGERLDQAFWEVNAAAAGLVSHGCTVSARYLQDRRLRMQFNRELAYYAQRVVDDVVQRRISPEEGLGRIQAESSSLVPEIRRVLEQVVGMAGGASQVVTGAGSCIGSMGTLCVVHGMPLIAHGGNNFYENARGLYEGRSDVVGPVRALYQSAAKEIGYSEREGNIAYYAADLVLSGSALARKVPKRGSWRLFRYIKSDKESKIMQLGGKGLIFESATSWLALKQLAAEAEQ